MPSRRREEYRALDDVTAGAELGRDLPSVPVEEPESEPVTLIDPGRPGRPGCLTVTAIDGVGDDVATIDALAQEIIATLFEQPGYLGTLFVSPASSMGPP